METQTDKPTIIYIKDKPISVSLSPDEQGIFNFKDQGFRRYKTG